MNFGKLYSLDKNGKYRTWEIFTVLNTDQTATIIVLSGQVDGKNTRYENIITDGKNIGKINETTPLQQANSEAQSKYNKKIDSGFSPNKDTIGTPVPRPMLAFDYNKRGKDITFPCFVQPKLDGVRAIFYNGKIYSRNGKLYPHLDFICKEITNVNKNLILDGELYSDVLTFQEINGIVKKVKMKPLDLEKIKLIKFNVFDVILDVNFDERLKCLQEFFSKRSFKYLNFVKTEICEKEKDLETFNQRYLDQGYEGLMLRNFNGVYSNDRSVNLQKLKIFDDSEFEIIGFTSGEGTEKDAIIIECKTKENKTFTVRPSGTIKDRIKLFKNGKKFIGKMVTIKYFGFTDDGIPRFPGTLRSLEDSIRSS